MFSLHNHAYMHTSINLLLIKKKIEGLRQVFVNIVDMATRSIKRYGFKKQNLEDLRKLAVIVSDPVGFRGRHGKLLNILNQKFDEGVLKTLVQFYDNRYHSFTFPDYQLIPTLEEYAYLVGLPVLNEVPFSGLEEPPKAKAIANSLHLKLTDVTSNLTAKGKEKILGLTSGFLIGKAYTCANAGNIHAFESILALLIYGLVLFPNVEGFVDANAIHIFLAKNPVPTLLGDIYHSLHYRTEKQDGTILGCAPLLYQWYTLHLPRSYLTKEKAQYSEKIMALTPDNVVWYNPAYDTGVIIDRCGEYGNVPLLGIHGGITYNPILARRQFGYPMKQKPLNIALDSIFYHYHTDSKGLREQFVKAWHTIHKKDSNQLGEKSDLTYATYNQWIIDEAAKYKMPYPIPRYLSSTTPEQPFPLLPATQEKYQEKMADLSRVCDTWKRKYEKAMAQVADKDLEIELQQSTILKQGEQLIEKNIQIQALSKRLAPFISTKERMDFFAGTHPDGEE
jgi:hypothetical protein